MTARDRFVLTRKYVVELDGVKALIMTEGDDWKPPGVHVRGVSDPTATRAIRNVDEWGEQLAELRKRESELEHYIGVTLELIEAVRVLLGDKYADVLEARYIDLLEWRDVKACGESISRTTAYTYASIAFDWMDSVGISVLLRREETPDIVL